MAQQQWHTTARRLSSTCQRRRQRRQRQWRCISHRAAGQPAAGHAAAAADHPGAADLGHAGAHAPVVHILRRQRRVLAGHLRSLQPHHMHGYTRLTAVFVFFHLFSLSLHPHSACYGGWCCAAATSCQHATHPPLLGVSPCNPSDPDHNSPTLCCLATQASRSRWRWTKTTGRCLTCTWWWWTTGWMTTTSSGELHI